MSYDKNKKPVILVSHGLGCNLTLLFFNKYLNTLLGDKTQEWKNKYIHLWIPVNGLFSGTSKSVRVTMSGDNEGLGLMCFTYGCNDWYWKIEKLMSGLLWSFPDNNVFQNLKIIKCNDKSYTINEYKDFLKLSGNDEAIKAFEETILPIRKYSLFPPGVKTQAIIGSAQKTEIMYNYIKKNDEKSFQKKFEPKKIYEQTFYKNLKMNKIQKILLKDIELKNMIGNGTVPFLSLRTPLLWRKKKFVSKFRSNYKKIHTY